MQTYVFKIFQIIQQQPGLIMTAMWRAHSSYWYAKTKESA